MFRSAHALSPAGDSRQAALDAAAEVLHQLGGAAPTAVFVFCTETLDAPVVLRAVSEALGTSALYGCSSPAVFGRGIVTRTGVALLAFAGDGLTVSAAAVEGLSGRGVEAGAQAAERALAGLEAAGHTPSGGSAALLLLPDGIKGNSVDVVRGVVDTIGRETRVCGGGSGDDFHFARALQFCEGEVHEARALAIGLASRQPIGVALRHGCAPWGPAMLVTEVSGAQLRALDFVPALERYRAVAAASTEGGGADDFLNFAMLHPLGLVQANDEHVLRSPVGLLEKGGVQCCSDIPANALIRVMEGSRETLTAAARAAGEAARAQVGEPPPAAALVFACISRDLVLGSDEEGRSLELMAVQQGLGGGVPLVGCVTFGGFGSLGVGLPQYHSKSVSVCAFGGPAA